MGIERRVSKDSVLIACKYCRSVASINISEEMNMKYPSYINRVLIATIIGSENGW